MKFGDRLKQIVGNRAKGRISKRMFQENKARQIFRKKKNISYPLIRIRTCFVFLKHPFRDFPFCHITGEYSVSFFIDYYYYYYFFFFKEIFFLEKRIQFFEKNTLTYIQTCIYLCMLEFINTVEKSSDNFVSL